MARWGEGDPRWIVEERADAKNVNNWHWSDKDATRWSKDQLEKLITDCLFSSDKCTFKNGDNKTEFTGKVEVPNFSDEYIVDNIEVLVTTDSSSSNDDSIRQFLRTEGLKSLKAVLSKYLTKLQQEYSVGLQLPTKTNNGTTVTGSIEKSVVMKSTTVFNKESNQKSKSNDASSGDYTISEDFFCAPSDLYKIFTSQDSIQACTCSKASIEPKVGGKFCMFDDNVTGDFVELVPNESLTLNWRKSDWPDNHFSLLHLKFESSKNACRLTVNHKSVPVTSLENTKEGWVSNLFLPIKRTFGYGTSSMF